MYIFNVFNDSTIRDIIIEYLKSKGVKYKVPKKTKEPAQNGISTAVFQTPLKSLQKVGVALKNGKVAIEVPLVLDTLCKTIEVNINVEGIFRKGGSASKQRELKQLLNSGLPLSDDCHVVDACNLVKLLLRELPEPLLPYSCHEMLLSCLLLSGEDVQKEAVLLTCLLLSREHVNVLAYVLEFLAKVSQHSESNKMDAKNLAIVLTPSIMPIDKINKVRSNFNIGHHISVIELLIKSAHDFGLVPPNLAKEALSRRGRKRRSASITRMFTGIRKMVGKNASPREESPPRNPELGSSPLKRKTPDLLPAAITVKRRREMADTTPRMCRMGGYGGGSLRKSIEATPSQKAPLSPVRKIEAPLTSKKEAIRKVTRKQGLKASKSSSSLLMSKKKSLERKLSTITWGKRRASLKDTPSTPPIEQQKQPTTKPTEDEVITIPRKQYEEMVIRVSCMEKKLQEQEEKTDDLESEQLAQQFQNDLRIRYSHRTTPTKSPAVSVQAAFEKTLEESEHLAPQIQKDVRLRWSSEQRVVRSPSQRKIGTIRRRSKELARSNSAGAKVALQRGRPNTKQTGLKSPRDLSQPKEEWKSGSLALPHLARLKGSPQKRDSIACLRKNNIGMVHAKAKFFDSLNHSTDGEADKSTCSMERRLREVQAEMQQSRLKENRKPVIKPALCAPPSLLKTPRSVARSVTRNRATPLKALPDNLTTPLRGVRRSPRILSRTMSMHVSSCRTP